MSLKLSSAKRKGSSMANEDNAQGIDDLLDDIEDAPTPEDIVPEPETPAAETPAAEPENQPVETPESPESIAEAESQVAKLFPQVDHSGKTVPVDKHIALRQRAKNAEAERDALKAKQANVDISVLDELANLIEGGEDEYIDKATLKQVVEKLPQAINNIAQQNINKVVQENNSQNLMAKIQNDEAAFRKDNADYDAVTNFVSSRNLISDAERQAIFSSPNTAQALYELGQKKIAEELQVLGIAAPSTPPTDNTQQPTEEQPAAPAADTNEEFDPIDDDEAFDMFAGGGQTP